jgi:hypothetical protein
VTQGDVELHPTRDQVRALAANPQLRAEFENLGLRILRAMGAGGTTYHAPAEDAEYISTRWAAEAPSAAEPEQPAQRLPNEGQLADHAPAKIEKAAKMFARRETAGAVKRETGLSPDDTRRVREMLEMGLLRIKDDGSLDVDPRVKRNAGRIQLRYLDNGRWADPRQRHR